MGETGWLIGYTLSIIFWIVCGAFLHIDHLRVQRRLDKMQKDIDMFDVMKTFIINGVKDFQEEKNK